MNQIRMHLKGTLQRHSLLKNIMGEGAEEKGSRFNKDSALIFE